MLKIQVPGQIIISQQNGKNVAKLEAFVARDWLQHTSPSNKELATRLFVESWKFDGRFMKSEITLRMNDAPSLKDKFNIIDLPIYPMRFGSEQVVQTLRDRGRMFWKCRIRKYVSYANTNAADDTQDITDSRYMIDIATYKRMHSHEDHGRSQGGSDAETENELESEHMAQESPKLGDDFFMCLPTTIPGFHMQKKEWGR